MADKMEIAIVNDIEGQLTIHLHFDKNQTPEKVIVVSDGKTSYLSPQKPYQFKYCGIRTIVILALIIGVTMIIGGVLTILNLKRNHPGIQIEENNNSVRGTVLRIVTRDQWLAKPESEALILHKFPVHRVIILQTSTDGCTSEVSCAALTLNIQEFHMDSKGFGDIGYNFLIGGDGAVYEGRGWDKQGAHTLGYNSDSIGIAFIGTYIKLIPTEGQLNALKLIIAEGIRLNKLVEDYRLYGARQFVGTESPGNALFEIIRKWPHWSKKPY